MKACMRVGAALCLAGMSAASAQNPHSLPLGAADGGAGLSGVRGHLQAFDQHPDRYSMTHTLPLVMAADSAGLTGFVRIVNRSGQAGRVQIWAIDDTGEWFGPVSLSIGAEASVHFDSSDLERGDASKGLPSGVGDGEGNWRLDFVTELDIQPLSYVRTGDGFVTAMHDIAPNIRSREHSVLFFNPGSNSRQVSRLRMFNPCGECEVDVAITGRDDAGVVASGTVRLTLPGGAARTLTAQELEEGGEGIDGSLGDGAGKWRLTVTANDEIEVMSLLQSPTGHLANLSTAPGPLQCSFSSGLGRTREAAEQAALANCLKVSASCHIAFSDGFRMSRCNSDESGRSYGALAGGTFAVGARWCRARVGRARNYGSAEEAVRVAIRYCSFRNDGTEEVPGYAEPCSAGAMLFAHCGAVALGIGGTGAATGAVSTLTAR